MALGRQHTTCSPWTPGAWVPTTSICVLELFFTDLEQFFTKNPSFALFSPIPWFFKLKQSSRSNLNRLKLNNNQFHENFQNFPKSLKNTFLSFNPWNLVVLLPWTSLYQLPKKEPRREAKKRRFPQNSPKTPKYLGHAWFSPKRQDLRDVILPLALETPKDP